MAAETVRLRNTATGAVVETTKDVASRLRGYEPADKPKAAPKATDAKRK